LQWGDIDFASSKVFVRRTIQEGKFYEPKTVSSKRQIFIPPMLIEELKVYQARQTVELDANPHELVFPYNKKGLPMDPRTLVRKIFEPALKRAELRTINFHALRHSYVSMLINQGANIKFIQKQVGHASAQLTWDVYGHLYPETEKAVIDKLGQAIEVLPAR